MLPLVSYSDEFHNPQQRTCILEQLAGKTTPLVSQAVPPVPAGGFDKFAIEPDLSLRYHHNDKAKPRVIWHVDSITSRSLEHSSQLSSGSLHVGGAIPPRTSAYELTSRTCISSILSGKQSHWIPTLCSQLSPRVSLAHGTCTPSVPFEHTPVQFRSPCNIDRRSITASW